MPPAVFLDAVERVSEQLWHDDPPQIWQAARQLIDDGVRRHEILHELARATRRPVVDPCGRGAVGPCGRGAVGPCGRGAVRPWGRAAVAVQ